MCHEIRNLFILLCWSALLAGMAGCGRNVPQITLDEHSLSERTSLLAQTLAAERGAARYKEWHTDHGERIGARVSIINIFRKNGRPCKEYFMDTFLAKSGDQIAEQEHRTVCLDPATNAWTVAG